MALSSLHHLISNTKVSIQFDVLLHSVWSIYFSDVETLINVYSFLIDINFLHYITQSLPPKLWSNLMFCCIMKDRNKFSDIEPLNYVFFYWSKLSYMHEPMEKFTLLVDTSVRSTCNRRVTKFSFEYPIVNLNIQYLASYVKKRSTGKNQNAWTTIYRTRATKKRNVYTSMQEIVKKNTVFIKWW